MSTAYDLIVLGAGPAGSHAALMASQQGMRVVLLDEQMQAGGQIWRAPLYASGKASQETLDGNAMREALAQSSVTRCLGRRVWSITSGYRLDALGPSGNETYTAPRLIVATGAHERIIPFPGWTLPGILGLAAATILIKSHAVAPPKGWVAAGVGPLLAAVAGGFTQKGHPPQAIIDQSSPADWFKALPALSSRPTLLKQGLGWVLAIAGQRIPVYFSHRIVKAEGEDSLSRLTIAPIKGGAEKNPHHLHPLCRPWTGAGGEVPKLLGAKHRYEQLRGGWIADCDDTGQTSLPGLWAIGDGAGIRGGALAVHGGELSGLAAAHDAGFIDKDAFTHEASPVRAKISALGPFSKAMAHMMALKPQQVAAITPDTTICRCEDVTRGQIDAAIAAGARNLNQLKHFTRCGMGPCQGRMCGDVAAEVLAQGTGIAREDLGFWTARPPLRPVALKQMLGDFSYSDIPIPKPAPL